MEKRQPSYTVSGNANWYNTVQRTVWKFFKKMHIELSYDPTIPVLGIHTEEIKIERDTCIPVFTAALFTVARTWKQPVCPLADECIRKL